MRQVQYRLIDGFPGYRVGDDGSVWTCKSRGRYSIPTTNWKKMKPVLKKKKGLLRICLCINNVKHYKSVHTLVLEAFVGPCPVGMEGCHNDGNGQNNRRKNLRWDTHKSNIADKIKHGTIVRGSKQHLSKLKEKDIPRIFEMARLGMTMEGIGRVFGVTGITIKRVLDRSTWKHVEIL